MVEGERETPPETIKETRAIEESWFRAFFAKLRKRKIIETLAAFIGGGWLTYEIVHWILVSHYHLSETLLDITIVTILGALLGTLIWRWFSGREQPRKFKLELVLIPLVVLVAVLIDINLILHLGEPESETIPASKRNRIFGKSGKSWVWPQCSKGVSRRLKRSFAPECN